MFLPSQLPNGVRQKSDIECEQQMGGGKGKKARAGDRDEMLGGPSSPLAGHRPSTSVVPNSGGFVARSWARISGRRRRQKRRMAAAAAAEERREERVATTLTTLDGPSSSGFGQGHGQRAEGWPAMEEGGGGNLAGLAHLEEEEERSKRHFLGRGMDRLRRSIRRSFHKGSNSQSGQVLTHSSDGQPPSSSNGPLGGGGISPKNYCHSDEIAVRSAACSFPVKYLGACEVFESRGMSVCEKSLQYLRTRKRAIKALLYVSGDGIRVVDQENNRGLIVDQTIEKVSFCSPDRQNEKGFAYICRDGATRRWMCHGFHAVKDSGERLSHAVGCAFAVCLEKKRKRDAETAAYKSAQALATSLTTTTAIASASGHSHQHKQSGQLPEGASNEQQFARTNQAYRSFRQLSISERRADPQKAILVEQSVPVPYQHPHSTSLDSPNCNIPFTTTIATNGLAATPRPSANPTLFERTGSLRAPILPTNVPPIPGPKPSSFNRFNSLQYAAGANDPRANLSSKMSLYNEPIWEGEDGKDNTENEAASGDGHWPSSATGANNRFYRTLPHSLPNFGQQGIINNWSLSNVIPATIPEEHKQPPPIDHQQQQQSPAEIDSASSPPADPFTSNDHKGELPKIRAAEDWLEQTFKRAASISSTTTLPRSATMNWPAAAHQNWAQFPQSQSFQQADWPNATNGAPPLQPPPPLPPWLNPSTDGPSNSFGQSTLDAAAQPSPALAINTLRAPPKQPATRIATLQSPIGKKGQDEANQSTQGATAAFKNHSRKASGSSRRIEYQLLQETDVSLSPPKSGESSVLERMIGESNGGEKVLDPFDVNWSQRVLEETAKQRQNGGGGGKQQGKNQPAEEEKNPFGWDMESVNV